MERLRQKLRSIATEHMAQDPAHDLAHLDRVWRNACIIADGEKNADRKVLLAAAYLHDLVNLPKDSGDRAQASRLSATKATPFLIELEFTESEIAATQHAIIAHSFSGNVTPKTLEAQILRDADRIDALGATGIARTFMISGALERPLTNVDDPFGQDRKLDDKRYAIDHWFIKLLRLHQDMLTASGRRLARERTEFMWAYLQALADELGAEFPRDWFDLVK